jgi:hypothetical protein
MSRRVVEAWWPVGKRLWLLGGLVLDLVGIPALLFVLQSRIAGLSVLSQSVVLIAAFFVPQVVMGAIYYRAIGRVLDQREELQRRLDAKGRVYLEAHGKSALGYREPWETSVQSRILIATLRLVVRNDSDRMLGVYPKSIELTFWEGDNFSRLDGSIQKESWESEGTRVAPDKVLEVQARSSKPLVVHYWLAECDFERVYDAECVAWVEMNVQGETPIQADIELPPLRMN